MHVKLDEMVVRGDKLLFRPQFLKADITLSAIVIHFLFLFHYVFRSPIYGRAFTLYSFFLHYSDRTLVHHLSLYLSICPIKHLLWLFVNGGGWECIVQGSSPHKCSQKDCCSAFNAVVAAFLLDISVFLSSSYMLEVHLYRWKFLEGHLSRLVTCVTDVRPIREG